LESLSTIYLAYINQLYNCTAEESFVWKYVEENKVGSIEYIGKCISWNSIVLPIENSYVKI